MGPGANLFRKYIYTTSAVDYFMNMFIIQIIEKSNKLQLYNFDVSVFVWGISLITSLKSAPIVASTII